MRPLSYICALLLLLCAPVATIAQSPTADSVLEEARQQAAAQARLDEQRAVTIRLLNKAKSQANANVALVIELRKATKGLSDRVSSLKTSDEGKRLIKTLDLTAADGLQRLIDELPAQPELISMNEKELAAASADVDRLLKDPPAGFVPPDQLQDELTQLSVTLRQMLSHIRERELWVTSLIAAAPSNIGVAKTPTLEAALADIRARQQRDINEVVWSHFPLEKREGEELARRETAEKVREAAREAELQKVLYVLKVTQQNNEQLKLQYDNQLRNQNEDNEREIAIWRKKLQEKEGGRNLVVMETEKIRLRQRCQDPEVKKLLAPFTAIGLWQPGDKVGEPWLHERKSVSLSALRTYGALQPTKRGLIALWSAGNATCGYWNTRGWVHPDRERPKWGFTGGELQLTQNDWQQLRHIQDLLNELGETMVELGTLAP